MPFPSRTLNPVDEWRGGPMPDPLLLAMRDGVAGASRRRPHPRISPPDVASGVDLCLHHGKQLARPLP